MTNTINNTQELTLEHINKVNGGLIIVDDNNEYGDFELIDENGNPVGKNKTLEEILEEQKKNRIID